MANLTIRNIPDNLLEKLRKLSRAEKRSLNSQILVLLENSIKDYSKNTSTAIPLETQIELWDKLSGEWDDPRSSEQITAEIISHRTPGRKVDL